MMSATYFGEITELDSRAVWYSDEEDDDDDECDVDEFGVRTNHHKLKSVEPIDHKTMRSNIQVNFSRVSSADTTHLNFSSCIISLSSSSQFKNLKLSNTNSLPFLGNFGSVGKAFAFPRVNGGQTENYLLWLLFDSSNPLISSYQVAYFVESLIEKLQIEFNLNNANEIQILSQQFSSNEQLEYLSNYNNPTTITKKLPFIGCPILPPSLIKSQFESSLFEQLSLSLKPALVICLPNPKNFWFDKAKNWPEVPFQIIEHKLNDDNLDKTLIFT